MIRQDEMPFQFDRPLFVRVPLEAAGRQWQAGEEFKWKEMSMPERNVMTLYNQRVLHHNAELEKQVKAGDGLEELNIDGLHAVVDAINAKVKAKTSNNAAFEKQKCKKSKILDKQRGLIRSWRRNYGHYEVD